MNLLTPSPVADRSPGSSPIQDSPLDIQFFTTLYSMKIPSSECLSAVQTLLDCPSKIAFARNFQGKEAQSFIDFLIQVLARTRLDDNFWRRGLRLIGEISKSQGIIPSPYTLQKEDIHVGEIYDEGGFGVVSDGEYQGNTVAIKRIKMLKGDPDKIFKRLCREVIVWKHLSHPNILPLLGVSISTKPHSFHILTEWMPNGNVSRYSMSNPMANRLQLLSEIVSAMTYLHELKVVHGDLKAANILVDKMGAALITDFGGMTMTDLSAVLSELDDSCAGTSRWMSPELLRPKSDGTKCRLTCESDCYALGMVIYEVLTGAKPFYNMSNPACVLAVVSGKRPPKPPHAELLGFSDTLWGLTQSCWSEKTSTRPTARQLLDFLSLASPTWAPPEVYPVVVDPSDSEDSLLVLDARDTGTGSAASVLVVPIFVAVLFLSISLLPIRRYK